MKSTSRSKVIKSSLHDVEIHHSKHLRRIDSPNKERDSRACTGKSVYPRTRAINKNSLEPMLRSRVKRVIAIKIPHVATIPPRQMWKVFSSR